MLCSKRGFVSMLGVRLLLTRIMSVIAATLSDVVPD